MKLSLNWLNRYVKIDELDPKEISHQLSTKTCEVEAIHAFGQGLDEIVFGKVVECGKHPNADKLSVTTVDVGSETLQIVCGAPNVAKGQTVAVAKVGSSLPDGTKLKNVKLRGVDSFGMILSEREMGLSEEHDGIFVLDAEAKPGSAFYEKLPVKDWVLEIDNKSVTHRPDLWGHYGFARELAAIFKRPLKKFEPPVIEKTKTAFPIEIEDSKGCFRYLGLEIQNVRVGESPAWMKQLLRAIGQRPISNLVDLSNFIMFEIGQPTHAFDREKLAGGKILVRRAKTGEEIVTLDGVQRKLQASDLLITDGKQPVALAGVMGAQNSEVSSSTTKILLESACFDPASVRRTASRLALRSEASSRFEKSLDPQYAELAVRRFAELIIEVSPGAKLVSLQDVIADSVKGVGKARDISLRASRVSEKLGTPIASPAIIDVLKRLEFQVQIQGDALTVSVPSFRPAKDISIEADLIEEIGRIHGYEQIDSAKLLAPVIPPASEDERKLVRLMKERLSKSFGFTEALHYSFLPNRLASELELTELKYVTLNNPIIQEQDRIRRSVLASLMGDLESGLRSREELRLFEIGKGYIPELAKAQGEPKEILELAAVWGWKSKKPANEVFYRVKGLIQSLLAEFRVEASFGDFTDSLADESKRFLGPVFSTVSFQGTALGYFGELQSKKAKKLGVSGQVFGISLDLRALLAIIPPAQKLRPLPKFPGISVDVAVAMPATVSFAEVQKNLVHAGGKLLAELRHFDTFRMKDGRKSFAFHALLISPERTLTDKEEAEFIKKVAEAAKQMGGELRG